MGDSLRLRIEFEATVGVQQVYLRQWFQPKESSGRIKELAEEIIDTFKLGTNDVLLSLRGFPLAPESSTTLLREGDIIVVAANNLLQIRGTRLDMKEASLVSNDHRLLPPLPFKQKTEALPIAPKGKPKNRHSGPGEAKSTSSSSSSSEDEAALPKRGRQASNKNLVAPKSKSLADRPRTAEKRKLERSRSAARKKAKRKLIREGVLPHPAKKKAKLDIPLQPLALPPVPSPMLAKRGEGAVYDDPRVTEFMKTGHVRFDDSDDEERVQPRAPEEARGSRRQGSGNSTPPQAVQVHTKLAEPCAGSGIDVTRLPIRIEMPHIDFERLPRVDARPVEGSIVAYKLLELDANFSPQVSEWRCGKVTKPPAEMDTAVSLEPWPDKRVHPQAAQRKEREPEDSNEEGDSFDNGYDSDGMLTTFPDNFAELRSVTRHPSSAQQAQAALSAVPEPASQPLPEQAATIGPGSGADDSAATVKSGGGSGGTAAVLLPRALSKPQGVTQSASGGRSTPKQLGPTDAGVSPGSAAAPFAGGVRPAIRPIPRMQRPAVADQTPPATARPESEGCLVSAEIAALIAMRTAELSAAAGPAGNTECQRPSEKSGGELAEDQPTENGESTGKVHKSRIRGGSIGRFLTRLREEQADE